MLGWCMKTHMKRVGVLTSPWWCMGVGLYILAITSTDALFSEPVHDVSFFSSHPIASVTWTSTSALSVWKMYTRSRNDQAWHEVFDSQGRTAGSALALHQHLGVCLACPPGKYSTAVGSVRCERCVPGTIASGTGNVACTPCAAGMHSGYMAESCFDLVEFLHGTGCTCPA